MWQPMSEHHILHAHTQAAPPLPGNEKSATNSVFSPTGPPQARSTYCSRHARRRAGMTTPTTAAHSTGQHPNGYKSEGKQARCNDYNRSACDSACSAVALLACIPGMRMSDVCKTTAITCRYGEHC